MKNTLKAAGKKRPVLSGKELSDRIAKFADCQAQRQSIGTDARRAHEEACFSRGWILSVLEDALEAMSTCKSGPCAEFVLKLSQQYPEGKIPRLDKFWVEGKPAKDLAVWVVPDGMLNSGNTWMGKQAFGRGEVARMLRHLRASGLNRKDARGRSRTSRTWGAIIRNFMPDGLMALRLKGGAA